MCDTQSPHAPRIRRRRSWDSATPHTGCRLGASQTLGGGVAPTSSVPVISNTVMKRNHRCPDSAGAMTELRARIQDWRSNLDAGFWNMADKSLSTDVGEKTDHYDLDWISEGTVPTSYDPKASVSAISTKRSRAFVDNQPVSSLISGTGCTYFSRRESMAFTDPTSVGVVVFEDKEKVTRSRPAAHYMRPGETHLVTGRGPAGEVSK